MACIPGARLFQGAAHSGLEIYSFSSAELAGTRDLYKAVAYWGVSLEGAIRGLDVFRTVHGV